MQVSMATNQKTQNHKLCVKYIHKNDNYFILIALAKRGWEKTVDDNLDFALQSVSRRFVLGKKYWQKAHQSFGLKHNI